MEGELWGLATHPSKPYCITASDDGTVRVWDTETHKMTKICPLKKPVRCVGFSHNGGAIAVGMKDGGFVVLDADNFNELASFTHRKEEISDVKFSPSKLCLQTSKKNFSDIILFTVL